MASNIGTGTTVTFTTSSFTADILSVSRSGISRGAIDVTHMGTTGGREFIPTDLYDPGELELEIGFLGSTNPPFSGAAETVTIDAAGAGTGHKWASSAFVTNVDFQIPLEEKMTATITLKCTGDITQS